MGQLVNINTPNLLNGVSQQAEQLRRSTQAVDQINAVSSLIDGLKKRPPTNNIKKVYNTGTVTTSNYTGFTIDRSSTEKHHVGIVSTSSTASLTITDLVTPSSTVSIIDETGNAVDSADLAYLRTNNPKDDLRATVVEDFIFITNKSKQVALTADTSANPNPSGLVFIKQVQDGAQYWVDLWTSASGSGTPDYTGTFTAGASDVQNNVVVGLISSLTSAGAGSAFTLSHNNSSLLRVRKTNNSDFRIEIRGTMGESIYAFKDKAQSINVLPYEGYVGFKIQVTNNSASSASSYWVEFKPTNSSATGFATGVWEETIAPGITYKLDRTTMPHVLISEGSNVFRFRPMTWDERAVGDLTTNPDPSFVSNYVKNVFFWKGRLGLLTGESVCLSEISQYFNFFRTTVISLLDTDPIDVTLNSQDVLELNWFISNFDQTMVFSDKTQFSLGPNNDVVTPKTIQTSVLSKFEMYANCKPCTLGNSVFFGSQNGDYSLIKEMFLVQGGVATTNHTTEQCPRFIEGAIEKIEAINTENMLIVLAKTDRSSIYCYKFHDSNDTRVQSAWFKFSFNENATVHDIFTIGNTLYLLIGHADGAYLESMELSSGLTDSYSDTVALLDRRVTESGLTRSYSGATNLTTITLPYQLDTGSTPAIVTRYTSSVDGGAVLSNVESISSTQITVRGDYSSTPLWIGVNYTMYYVLSNVKLTAESSTGSSAKRYNGRLQVRYLNIEVNDTEYLKVEIQPFNRNKFTYNYDASPYVTGTGYSIVGAQPVQRPGLLRVPVFANAREIQVAFINEYPLESKVIGVNWEVTVNIRGSSI